METVPVIANVLGLAIGAGLNLYAAVLVTGLGIHYGWLTRLPAELNMLSHPVVLTLAAVLYAAEFVADKVPFVTPIWDGFHTFIRPAGAALLAMGVADGLDPLPRTLVMLAAGTVALGAHSSKMGVRLMAHATPEPATHATLSVAEDCSVIALLALVYEYPWVALPVLLVLLAAMAVLLPWLWRIARFLVAGLSGRLRPEQSGPPGRGVRVFSRKVPGAPRLWPGELVVDGEQTRFLFERWGRARSIVVGYPAARPEWGLVFSVVRCAGDASFYVARDWREALSAQTPAAASAQTEACR